MMEPAGRMKIVNPDVMASRVNAPAGTLRDTRGHGSFHAVLICKMHRTMHDRRGGCFFDGSCHVAFPVQSHAHAITDLELLRLPESLIRRLISQRRDRRPVGHEITAASIASRRATQYSKFVCASPSCNSSRATLNSHSLTASDAMLNANRSCRPCTLSAGSSQNALNERRNSAATAAASGTVA